MHEIQAFYDDRLFQHGIEFIAWDGAGLAIDHAPKRLAVVFSELVDGHRLEFEEQMLPNGDATEYRPVVISDSMQQRGIRDLRVEVFREPPIHSDIYITLEGEADPLRVTKRY